MSVFVRSYDCMSLILGFPAELEVVTINLSVFSTISS